MCLLCDRFAEGYKRWFLNPASYARRLYKVRREVVPGKGEPAAPGTGSMGQYPVGIEFLEAMDQKDAETLENLKKDFYERMGRYGGQVVSLEEALQILDIAWPITLVTCGCRRVTYGAPDEENFTCLALGPGMYKWERWPDGYPGGVQYLTPDEAKDVVTKLFKRGLVQTVGTHGVLGETGKPYIGGMCNCEYPDCVVLRTRIDLGLEEFLLKGHKVSKLNPELCNGCGRCVQRCQFRAITFSPRRSRVSIASFKCWGGGRWEGL